MNRRQFLLIGTGSVLFAGCLNNPTRAGDTTNESNSSNETTPDPAAPSNGSTPSNVTSADLPPVSEAPRDLLVQNEDRVRHEISVTIKHAGAQIFSETVTLNPALNESGEVNSGYKRYWSEVIPETGMYTVTASVTGGESVTEKMHVTNQTTGLFVLIEEGTIKVREKPTM
ncbi:hypothetical protein [Halomarina pelagica]|uniref:hypothetical protein n=1 Tax=Halomarina pelagica TaxID=2961599 RepID=UPI0020C43A4D|nr:hypothetical protein [Halomarina sp. BND7]